MSKAFPAGEWLKVALEQLGGKGGGKPTNAQGQGPQIDKLPQAMKAAKRHAEHALSKVYIIELLLQQQQSLTVF